MSWNTIKCMLVRDTAVGKTAYADNKFPTVYGGVSFMVGGVSYGFGVFDTTAYDRLRPLSYGQTDVFPICFSVDIPSSLNHVKMRWFPEAEQHCPGVPCVVVANKSIYGNRCSRSPRTTVQDEKLALEMKATEDMECSAKTRVGVQDVFNAVRRQSMWPPTFHRPVLNETKTQCVVL
ncbi:small GTPase CDC42 [Mycena sanguinolenta]|nr:small GTPase CDC42 [Mycena sanguinolenta]